MSNQQQLCPNCKQTDAVKPASIANLSSPIKPSDTLMKVVKVWRWLFGGFFVLFALTLILLLIGGTLLSGCSALLASSYDETGVTSLLSGALTLPLFCVGTLGLIIMGTIAILIPWLIGRYVNQNYQKRLAQWQRAMEKYKKLWFCSRCAGVWSEGQNRLVPVEHLQSFLYELQSTEPIWPL